MVVEETIKAIKEAERHAEQVVKDSVSEASSIIEKAQEESEHLKRDAEHQAQMQDDQKKAAAKEAGEVELSDALKMAEQDIMALKELVSGKEEDAIKRIISQLV